MKKHAIQEVWMHYISSRCLVSVQVYLFKDSNFNSYVCGCGCVRVCMRVCVCVCVYVCDQTRLPHTSNTLTLTNSNLTTQYAIALKFSHNFFP